MKKNKFTLFTGADAWMSYWLPIFTVLFYVLLFTVIIPYLKHNFSIYLLVVSIVFALGLPALTWLWFKLRIEIMKKE